MIVTCEQCATQFHLDDAKVPPGGVRVRCSRCKHAFFIEPAGEAPELGGVDRAAQDALDAEAPPAPEPDRGPVRAGLRGATRTSRTRTTSRARATGSSTRAPFGAESRRARPDRGRARRRARGDRRSARLAPARARSRGHAASPRAVADPDSAPKTRIWGTPRAGICSRDDAPSAADPAQRGAGGAGAETPSRSGRRRALRALPAAPVAEWTPPSRALGRARLDRAHGARDRVERDRDPVLDRRDRHARAGERSGRGSGLRRGSGWPGSKPRAISGRWVENAVAGSLFVVSGTSGESDRAGGGAGDADRRAPARRERRAPADRARPPRDRCSRSASCARRIRPASRRVRRRPVSRWPPTRIQPGQSLPVRGGGGRRAAGGRRVSCSSRSRRRERAPAAAGEPSPGP